MKVVLAEKPSVARDIARVLGVKEKKDGYIQGRGVAVTWAFGHLGGLADAQDYGFDRWRKQDLPILPQEFKYKVSGNDGAKKQFKIIKGLFDQCEEIVVATDAGREGENIFRTIYRLSECKKPFRRLWISSLTEKAIKEGFANLKPGHDYDRIANAAECREKADWAVGINATRALTLEASHGQGVLSVGRVQTPTLAIICQRYLEHEAFNAEDYFLPRLTLDREQIKFRATYVGEKISIKEKAQILIDSIGTELNCDSAEKKSTKEGQPLPFDLTSLQSECNKKFGFTADRTLKLAQALYERHKVITYPRTDSRYISDDVFATIPKLIDQVSNISIYSEAARSIDQSKLPKKCVNNEKVSDHHAILPTGKTNYSLDQDETKVFDLVTRYFLAAFMQPCEKEITTYKFLHNEVKFESKGTVIVNPGWRSVIKPEVDKESDDNQSLPLLSKGDTCKVAKKEVIDKKTKPKPIHTESSLLKAMETCGKEVEEGDLRDALKGSGIGTPATRAAIIEILIRRIYIERKSKKLVPTQKGLSIYKLLKDKDITSPELTGKWEKNLKEIELGKSDPSAFMDDIFDYSRKVVGQMFQVGGKVRHNSLATCPKCKEGGIVEGKKAFGCDRWKEGCDFFVYKEMSGKAITQNQLQTLIAKGETGRVKGFKNKEGKSFEANIKLDENMKPKLDFSAPERANLGKCPKCKQGDVVEGKTAFGCIRFKEGCDFRIYRETWGKKLTTNQAKSLVSKGETSKIKGFKSKAGNKFEAILFLDEEFKVKFRKPG